jgi:hypothetical protein
LTRGLLSMSVLALAVATAPALAQKADRPDVKVGDRWRFEVRLGTGPNAAKTHDLVRVTTSVTPAGIECTDNGRKVVLTPDLNEIDALDETHSDKLLQIISAQPFRF